MRTLLRMFVTLGAVAAVGSAAVIACSSDSQTDPNTPMGLQLALSPARDTIFITDTLTGTETLQLTATATGVSGQPINVPAGRIFESQDPRVATVDSLAGLVRARGVGTADITVRVNGVRAHATIVVAHPTNRILVTPGAVDILEDNAFTVADTARLKATAYGADGKPLTGVAFVFTSSDPAVMSVDPSGKVTAARLGTATITAQAHGMSATVTVHALRGARTLTLAPAADTIFVDRPIGRGDTMRVTPTARDSAGVVRAGVLYAYSTAAPSVATVTPAGTLTAVDTGHTTVTVTGADLSASTPVAILSLAKTVSLTAPASSWLVGDTVPLSASATDWKGATLKSRTFTYAASDARATVSADGRAVFVAPTSGTPVTFSATTAFTTGTRALAAFPREYVGGAGALASGMDATCGLLPLGRVYCFGRAPLIGVAKDTSCFNDRADDPRDVVACTLVPLRIASDIPMQSVAVGDSVACAITTALSGATPKAYCWGDDTFGELGNGRSAPGTSATPSLVVGPLGQAQTLTQIAAGRAHACGLAPSGLAYCWGRDSTYQLGGGDRRKINSSTPIPVAMPTGVTFTALVAGRSHSCGLAVDGTAYCWGYNHDGQLGYTTANDTSDVPTAVPGPKYIQLTAGARHTCGLTNLQTIYCWGANDSLQSGHAGAGTPTPVQVPGSGYFAVAAGWTHTCALQAGGIAVCWGGNDYGQLGRGAGTAGAPAMSAVPVPVAGGLVFGTISAGRRTSCAVAPDGAYCWGSTVLGAMGSQLQALTVATPTKTATPQ